MPEAYDWAKVEKDLSRRGMTLKLLWEEWHETHPDGMSYVTWCRRFRHWRPRRDVTMRQNRRPGERLFVDYAGMTVPILIDRVEREAQVFIASMGVSGRLYAEATLSQKIDDWCASHVRCFEDMGRAPQVVVPDNVKAAVKQPSRYEPVLNETYADLLDHYGVEGFPARSRKPRDKALVENGVLHGERWILAPLRNHVFHDLASLNRAIAVQVEKINTRPYADGTGENRNERFEGVDLPHMKPLPTRRWQRTLWRQNTVHPDYHIAIERHFYSVPHEYVGKEVDVRLRGSVIDVFHRGRQIASHLRSNAKGRATTVEERFGLRRRRRRPWTRPPGRAPSLVAPAVERRRPVALALGLALEVDAVGVVDDAIEYRVRDCWFSDPGRNNGGGCRRPPRPPCHNPRDERRELQAPRSPRQGQAKARPAGKLRHREKHQGLSRPASSAERPRTRGPRGSPPRAASSPTAPRQSETRNLSRRDNQNRKPLAIAAARRNHPLAAAARNLILIDARLSSRLSRHIQPSFLSCVAASPYSSR